MKISKVLLSVLLPVTLLAACSDSSDSDDNVAPAPVPGNPDLGLKTPPFVLDDFKSCSTEFKTPMETYWFSFNDVADKGKSSSLLELKTAADGSCSLAWTGKVTTDYEYGYSGIGIDLGPAPVKEFKNLVLKVRGDGAAYRVKLPMNTQLANNEFNFFGADVNCGDGSAEWKTVTVDLTGLQQEQGWGKTVALDLTSVGKIQIQTKGQPIPAFNCEIGGVTLQN